MFEIIFNAAVYWVLRFIILSVVWVVIQLVRLSNENQNQLLKKYSFEPFYTYDCKSTEQCIKVFKKLCKRQFYW